jgi:hypothetical protein
MPAGCIEKPALLCAPVSDFKPVSSRKIAIVTAADVFRIEQAELARLQVTVAHVEDGVTALIADKDEHVVDDTVQR